MNILFISCAYSDTQKDLFLENSKRGYQSAAQNFQESLFDGFIKNTKIKLNVLSIPSLSTYPKGCNIMIIKDSPFLFEGERIGVSYGFLNLPFINHFHQSRLDKEIDYWYNNNSGAKCIVVYAMLKNQMEYAVLAKSRHPDIKICLIIPDLPIYMHCNKYYRLLGLQKREIKAIDKLLHSFDCFVVLTEPMLGKLKITGRPYSVIEGIYRPLYTELTNSFYVPSKTIMYAGGIQTRYGVFDLIEAFHQIQDDDYKLILCGPCSERAKLQIYLEKDKRIEYLGVISTAEVRKWQRMVALLVNPRHSTEEFTKYSFPSKTLEYMASGTPVLMSKLPSLPEEYMKYLFIFDDETVDGMRQTIQRVCSLNGNELKEKGQNAKNFILKFKNSVVQVNKIIDLIIGEISEKSKSN